METYMLNAILQSAILSVSIPVVLIVAWKLRTHKSLVPFGCGILVFIAFAKVLEMIPHAVFLLPDTPIANFINNNIVCYVLYASLMAGLFEEVGRYVAFRFVLTKHTGKETAVTYGIGHGGIECVLVLGLTYFQYYAYGQLINNGSMDKMLASYSGDAASVEALNQLIDNIKGITQFTCYMADLERVSALLVQIGLSILVFQAVHVAGKKYMLGVAIILHMLMDIPAAMYQKGALGLVPTEIFLFVYGVCVLLFAVRIYSTLDGDKSDKVTAEKKHELFRQANQSRKND